MATMKKVDARLDRQIIAGMVISDKYLRAVVSIYRSDLLTAPYAVQVAGWCIEYLQQYDKAPGVHIYDIFRSHQRSGLDEDDADAIEDFLDGLKEDGELERSDKFNVEYLLDQTERLFRQRTIKALAEDIEADLASGELDDAEGRLVEYRKLERPSANGINPLATPEAYQAAFESREEPLFKLPGAYGDMINPHLIRGGFVGFLGCGKAGKTWRLIDLAMWAAKSRCNVAFFQLGDLTQNDYMVRQGIYLSKKSNDYRYCGELIVPVLDCQHNLDATCPEGHGRTEPLVVEEVFDRENTDWIYGHTPCTRCYKQDREHFKGASWWSIRPKITPLSWREAWKNTERWRKRHHAKGFRLATYPNSFLNVRGIEQQLDLWEQTEGFVPDVILLDYPDIMAPDDSRKEKRHQEDERWRLLRGLSQERHVCLIVVTQTNRDGFRGRDLWAGDVSEDKRKMDHVTAFFALNQTDEEADQGKIRIANIVLREGRKTRQQVVVLQCLEMGQSYLSSYWWTPPKKEEGDRK